MTKISIIFGILSSFFIGYVHADSHTCKLYDSVSICSSYVDSSSANEYELTIEKPIPHSISVKDFTREEAIIAQECVHENYSDSFEDSMEARWCAINPLFHYDSLIKAFSSKESYSETVSFKNSDNIEEVILSSGTVDGNQVTGWFNLNNTLFWDGEKWINI